MIILLASVGRRGDIEPFLAIEGILQAAGYEVSFSFPEQLRLLVGNFPAARQLAPAGVRYWIPQ
jgi:UDP:flavonoid glycosyltransferase YjiC (YdhE family)